MLCKWQHFLKIQLKNNYEHHAWKNSRSLLTFFEKTGKRQYKQFYNRIMTFAGFLVACLYWSGSLSILGKQQATLFHYHNLLLIIMANNLEWVKNIMHMKCYDVIYNIVFWKMKLLSFLITY